jgi:hypothetical protein
MPSTIKTPAELSLLLRQTIQDMKGIVASFPGDTSLQSILEQLKAAEQWTCHGQPPTLDQKGTLNFGLLASKYLDEVDQSLAQRIYDIASFITYWQ